MVFLAEYFCLLFVDIHIRICVTLTFGACVSESTSLRLFLCIRPCWTPLLMLSERKHPWIKVLQKSHEDNLKQIRLKGEKDKRDKNKSDHHVCRVISSPLIIRTNRDL